MNFECHRRCSCSLSLLFSVKPKKSQPKSNGPCLESNSSLLCLRLSFLPLSHWDIIFKSKKLDKILDSLSFLLSCQLFFYFFLLPVTEKFRGSPAGFLSQKVTKKAAALRLCFWKEHQLSREDLWILISQDLLGQTLI